jgi:acetyl esterase/lipase
MGFIKKIAMKNILLGQFMILAVCSLFACAGRNNNLLVNERNNLESETSDPSQSIIYLWPEGNMPSTTSYRTVANSNNPDGPDFRPNMIHVPVKEGVEIKGAVLICAGGAFQFRSDGDGFPVAEQLNALGYQSFIVNYRLRPYTQEEAALDLARAVRYVRSRADFFGIDEKNIAVIGFSAGGILCGELLLNFDGLVNGTALDRNYVPDELDKVSADASAVSMIYSFYGRLSVASTDVRKFAASNLPPTYFLYGSQEIFRSQIEACARAVEQAGVSVESRILEGWQHGFGARGNWFEGFDAWLSPIFGF